MIVLALCLGACDGGLSTEDPGADGSRPGDDGAARDRDGGPGDDALVGDPDAGDDGAVGDRDAGGPDGAGDAGRDADSPTCGSRCCDVTEFGAVPGDGRDDQPAIQAAITAALDTSHHYVYIPEGVYDIASGIDMTSGGPGRVVIAGAHSKRTRLRWVGNLHYHIFNTAGGHDYFKVDLRTMSIDGSHLDYASGSGHAVRAGNGWDRGHLHMHNLNIVHPGFYGVGIQNGDSGDIPARSVWLMDSLVAHTGSDGIDLKAPPDSNNYDVHINNVVFHDVGNSVRGLDESGGGSDAAVDLTADGFGIYRVTIVTDAYKTFTDVYHPDYDKRVTGTNTVQGIRLRRRGDSWDEPAARNGTINRVYIKYPERGVFFEGWNSGVVMERMHIKSVPQEAVYLRGIDNEIASSVCAVDVGDPLHISSARGGATTSNNTIDGPTGDCIPISEVGALADNRDADNRMDVAEPMSCD